MSPPSGVDEKREARPGPGAPLYDDGLRRALTAALASKGERYRPRTRHLDGGAPRYTNRLIAESSPYLLQHAHNPVSWFPWGDEAFAAARRDDKPVFLSIGYSTCHWCHVMEEESFEDVEIAQLLNERFVSIKVDREERPDVDAVYMAAVTGLTGHGGWPMTVFLTPDKKPFFGGTYFPARDGDRRGGRGFLTLLRGIDEAWRRDRRNVERATEQIVGVIEAQLAPPTPAAGPDDDVASAVLRFYEERFDGQRGGLRVRQKFPSSFPNRLMLRLARRRTDVDERGSVLGMVEKTLDAMADGGLHDQVGGGFHRYSTDPDWLVPHFEKMLYDNALLALAYVEGWQAFGHARYREVAEDVLAYVERDMTSPEGAFYSATDADSLTPEGHREEGYFFTWTPAELRAELGPDLAEVAIAFYDVRAGGNFEGRSILHRPRPAAEVAARLGVDEGKLAADVRLIRDRLVDARGERPPPLRDEKVLTAWNGLMISAFARAGVAFGVSRYVDVAARAARFLLEHAEEERSSSKGERERRLFRVVKDNEARVDAYLDDYAALIGGLLDVFAATGAPRWLEEAERLAGLVEARFADEERGGYFLTADDHEALLVREKPAHDGAEPSGASVHAQNLARLALLTDDERYRRAAERTLAAYGEVWKRAPHALTEMLIAWDLLRGDARQLVVVGARREALGPFFDVVGARFLPDAVVIAVDRDAAAALAPRLPALRERGVIDGEEATAYLCRGTVCDLPARTPAMLAEQLDRSR